MAYDAKKHSIKCPWHMIQQVECGMLYAKLVQKSWMDMKWLSDTGYDFSSWNFIIKKLIPHLTYEMTPYIAE